MISWRRSFAASAGFVTFLAPQWSAVYGLSCLVQKSGLRWTLWLGESEPSLVLWAFTGAAESVAPAVACMLFHTRAFVSLSVPAACGGAAGIQFPSETSIVSLELSAEVEQVSSTSDASKCTIILLVWMVTGNIFLLVEWIRYVCFLCYCSVRNMLSSFSAVCAAESQ